MRASRLLRSKDYVGLLERHSSPAVPRAPKGNNIVVDSASGSWITAVGGRKYLDFQTGIGVASTGHCHPRVVEAVREQVGKGIHLQQNCGISRPVVELIEALRVQKVFRIDQPDWPGAGQKGYWAGRLKTRRTHHH